MDYACDEESDTIGTITVRGSGITTMKLLLFVRTCASCGRENYSTLTTANDKRRPSRLTWSNPSLCTTPPSLFPRSGDLLHMGRDEAKDAGICWPLRMATPDQLDGIAYIVATEEVGELPGNFHQDHSQGATRSMWTLCRGCRDSNIGN